MTVIEAYNFTMQKVNELKDSGIEVIMKPTRSRDNPDTVAKYNKPDRIPPELWYHVTFKIIDANATQKVHEAVNYLGMCGIGFDTGGWKDGRDWELDWSFTYHKGEEDWVARDARDEVEDMINNWAGNE